MLVIANNDFQIFLGNLNVISNIRIREQVIKCRLEEVHYQETYKLLSRFWQQ